MWSLLFWRGPFNFTFSKLIRQIMKVYFLSFEFSTIGVFVRLSDRSLQREEKKNFVKNCHQWGLKLGPLDLQANVLPTELGRNLLGWRFLKWALFVSCTTSHIGLCLFLESIEHDFKKVMKIQAGNWMLTFKGNHDITAFQWVVSIETEKFALWTFLQEQ